MNFKLFKARKGNELDAQIADKIKDLKLLVPIRQVLKSKDHYLIGDKKKFIKL